MSVDVREHAIASRRNTARYFVENPHVSLVLLVISALIGMAGYKSMPKQKDPTIPVRVALAVTPWPGVDADEIELLVTKLVESTISQNATIHPPEPAKYGLESLTLPGMSIVKVSLAENVEDTQREFSDIGLRLQALNAYLPSGAGPIQWQSGFGDTAALFLTIASPRERETSLALRARSAAARLTEERSGLEEEKRVAVFVMLPRGAPTKTLGRSVLTPLARAMEQQGLGTDARVLEGGAFLAVDVTTAREPAAVLEFAQAYAQNTLQRPSFHPDVWEPFAVREPTEIEAALERVAGSRYTYRQLEDVADLVSRSLQGVHEVSKVQKSGALQEQVHLLYSQEELASRDIPLVSVVAALAERKPGLAGGNLQAQGAAIPVSPSGELDTLRELDDVIVGETSSGNPVYMRELAHPWRTYESPPSLVNDYSIRNEAGDWENHPAITLSVQMRKNEQIAAFGANVDVVLASLQDRLPEDLLIARTSDQPRQVEENVELFTDALFEAILLVVFIAWVGFRNWRSAALMMISIPLTLALTFAALYPLGITIQQISLATLIIALGLLVDDPVVAGDAIERELASGTPRRQAAWLGPTLLASAILFATVTNVVAYLPFMMLKGDTGNFLASLPVVMAVALIASRLVSMTFIPFLGYHFLRAPKGGERPIEERRKQGFSGFYFRAVGGAIRMRWAVLAAFVALMMGGFYTGMKLKRSFFPHDVQYLSTVDIWLPNDASVFRTGDVARQVEAIAQRVAKQAKQDGLIEGELISLTSFVGGGSPRFWQTFKPAMKQPNYAQLLLEMSVKEDTPRFAPLLQKTLSDEVPGTWIDVKQLELNPLKYPIAVRLSARSNAGEERSVQEIERLRLVSDELIALMRAAPSSRRVRGDWGAEQFEARVDIDQDRASLAGVNSRDVSLALQAGFDGATVTTLREGDNRLPVLLRLRDEDRPKLAQLGELYVYPGTGAPAIPLAAIASVDVAMTIGRIQRLDQFRTVTVFGFPREGALSADIMDEIKDSLAEFEASVPPGFVVELSGEPARQVSGFTNLLRILAVSATGIFLALVFQFRNFVKPIVVLMGVPFGFAGGLASLHLMNESLSFMAFLGLVSLVGVIVSHIIVLFTFIEERREEGETLELALLDAGIVRLRPVLITVSATVLALIPLAYHGGPLWQPLCYAQIGGLTVATVISLVIIPVLYAICVKDLKVIRWEVAADKAVSS